MGGEIVHRGEEQVGGGEEVQVIVVTAVTVIGVGVGVEGGMGGAGDEEGASAGDSRSFAVGVAKLRRAVCALPYGMLGWTLKLKFEDL